MSKPLSIINSVAPIRICDNGGWTDTWFAGHGQIPAYSGSLPLADEARLAKNGTIMGARLEVIAAAPKGMLLPPGVLRDAKSRR